MVSKMNPSSLGSPLGDESSFRFSTWELVSIHPIVPHCLKVKNKR